MVFLLSKKFLILIILIFIKPTVNLRFEDARKAVIDAEDLMLLGGRIELNAKELLVDDIFMKAKLEELAEGFKDPNKNAAGMHFFKAKPLVEKSKVFRILQKMPKGSLLHIHSVASVSSEWVIKNLTYMPGMMRCTRQNGQSILTFRRAPKEHKCYSKYVFVNDERRASSNPRRYDQLLDKLINLYSPNPEVDYPNIDIVWSKFEDMFGTFNDVLQYVPAFKAYHRQMLQELYDDNIMYAEIRMGFRELYLNDGTTFSIDYNIKELLKTVELFRKEHPNFLGIKIIVTMNRGANPSTVREKLKNFNIMRQQYPEFIIGFDLVGQEDKGNPLYHYLEVLKSFPNVIPYFFHAGETNWYGASTDINLLDAILLNTTRIGHGYALMKHPVLWNTVKRRNLAIEVSPISNQVLNLVWDLRNHPGSFFISEGIPIVICNDDPGFWSAKGLSYDFYYAIMSLAPNHAGLKTLKKLIWTSVEHSILNKAERVFALQRLKKMWDTFLDTIITEVKSHTSQNDQDSS